MALLAPQFPWEAPDGVGKADSSELCECDGTEEGAVPVLVT